MRGGPGSQRGSACCRVRAAPCSRGWLAGRRWQAQTPQGRAAAAPRHRRASRVSRPCAVGLDRSAAALVVESELDPAVGVGWPGAAGRLRLCKGAPPQRVRTDTRGATLSVRPPSCIAAQRVLRSLSRPDQPADVSHDIRRNQDCATPPCCVATLEFARHRVKQDRRVTAQNLLASAMRSLGKCF